MSLTENDVADVAVYGDWLERCCEIEGKVRRDCRACLPGEFAVRLQRRLLLHAGHAGYAVTARGG